MANHSLPYTLPGRILLLVAIVLPIVGTCLSIYLISGSLAGRYPVFFYAAPWVAVSALLFYGGSALMRRCGIRFRSDDTLTPEGTAVAVRPKSAPPAKASDSVGRTAFCSVCDKDVAVADDDRCLECNWPI